MADSLFAEPHDDRPTIYLSNWSSHKTPGHHGPGRKWTIMASPRSWEKGEGFVPHFVPDKHDVASARAGILGWPEYSARFRRHVSVDDAHTRSPGNLFARRAVRPSYSLVTDGDTLCCSCARGKPCHRRIASEFLHDAGWRVVLDGVAWSPDGRPEGVDRG